MSAHSHPQASRRDFLRRTGQLALGSAALPLALNLAAIGRAAAFNAPSGDYKALVCVFLYGGNDYANTVVPYDTASYDQYSAIRGGGAGRTAGGIALGQADLAATLLTPTVAPVDTLGVPRQFALHPSMAALAGLFNAGHAAVQLNVGPLVKPLSRADYHSSNRSLYPRPPQLFSHNDQASIWQSSSPEGSKVGWGGNIGDLVVPSGAGLNSNAVFTGISVAGNTVFLSGDAALQYQVSTSGAIKIKPVTNTSVYGSTALPAALRALVQQNGAHRLEHDYNAVTRRAIDAEAAVSAALGAGALNTEFATDSLSQQLKMVARLIKGRTSLGVRRQVFFVSLGGFDLHDNLIAQHPTLLGNVSAALSAFYNATVELGVADAVTSFTASDFGRTLTSNGDGSDHGWGGHHFIVGGAVRGKAFYGTPPPVSVSDTKTAGVYDAAAKWHVGQGRLLPSTSVDQYAATLAQWFGVDPVTEMAGVLPNIVNFGGSYDGMHYPTDLGFMA
ncbi:MAG: DUF1501 domain-containing protein [Burkholderiales bacterium]|nr:DUF1501 domain-containing protein [Burkholderiales bacterium]